MLPLEELERLSRFAAGDLAESERRQMELELSVNPALARALRQLRYLDAMLEDLEADPVSESDQHLIHRVVRQRRLSKQWVAAIAAAAVVCAGAVLAFRHGRTGEGSADAQAANGARTHVNAGQSWSAGAPSQTLSAGEQSVQSTSEVLASERWAEFVQKMDALSDSLQPSLAELTRCYKQGLAQDPNLEGSIIAHLTLVTGPDGNGYVADATIAKDYTLASPFVASCVLKEVSGARVPAPAGGKDVVDLAFYFHRGEGGREPSVQIAKSSPAPAAPIAQTTQTVLVGDAPSRGPRDAAVTVVEISDPECPYCGRAHESINALYKELGDRVRFAFKFAPMANHRRAPTAAAAALAAGEQGKFWEYVDALFSHPDALDRAGLERTAVQLGLDMEQFKDALDSNRFGPAIEADQNQAKGLGVNAVPVFFINGRPLVGARPIDDIRAKIMEALSDR